MIIGTVRILPSPNRREEAIEVLRSIQGLVRAQAGCVACDVLEDRGSDSVVMLLERWETADALAAHLRSEAYRVVLEAIELSDGQPDVRFEHVSATEGMELIERSRDAIGPALRTGAGPSGRKSRLM